MDAKRILIDGEMTIIDQHDRLTNQGERAEVRAFRQFLLSDESAQFRQALNDLHVTLNLAAATKQLPNPANHVEPALGIADNLLRHAGAIDENWLGPSGWLGPEAATTLDAIAYRGRASELMAFGAFLLAAGVRDPDRFAHALSRIAFGVDPYSTLLGDVIGRKPLDVYPPQLPPELVKIRDFLDRTCVAGIVSAAAQFGRVASNHPRPMAGAQITEVNPDHGCAGDVVVIRGTGFGTARPANVTVMFTTRGGGCTAAQVMSRPDGSSAWSDTDITVIVPPDVGHGCIGLVEHPSGFEGIAESAAQFAGELETCLGPVASVAGDRIRGTAIKIMATACPDCSDPRTRFAGGPPLIRFAANGQGIAEIITGDDITITWQVANADDVTIVAVGGVLPELPGPFDPRSGSVKVENLALDDGTVGSWRLVATNRCGSTTATVEVVVRGRKALVLSGGGAKGAFEVGAVRCLRDVARVQPEIIAAASAGALNAAKLAEGGMALQNLEQLWLGMQNNSDLYVERQWFQVLSPAIKAVFQAGASSLGFEAGRLAASYAGNMILGALVSAMGVPGIVFSAFTSFYPVITGVIDLSRYYDAIKRALVDPSIFLFTPIEQKINANIDPVRVAASGIELRIIAVALESGRARVFNQHGIMLDSGFRVPLLDAIRASASIPIAFPPVPLSGPNGWEHYVDGGVRENAPLQAAVEAGAHRMYAILLNPTEVGFTAGFSQPTMIKIAGRSVDLVLDEGQRNDIAPYRGFGIPTTIIAPTFLVHDTLLVDPGLIAINMDYGYMRAYDEVVAEPAQLGTMRRLSDEITATRVEVWAAEHFANGERLPGSVRGQLVPTPDPVQLRNARDLKQTIRTKVYQRIATSTPDSVPFYRASWWQQWERHPWQPFMASPWDAFVSRLGTLPAETVPPA